MESLRSTGRYERGNAIAANRPLFVPQWSLFAPLILPFSACILSISLYLSISAIDIAIDTVCKSICIRFFSSF